MPFPSSSPLNCSSYTAYLWRSCTVIYHGIN